MKSIVLYVLMFFLVLSGDFKSAQLKYERVKNAYEEKEESLRQLCQEKGVDFFSTSIFIRVFKKEKELELWNKNSKGLYVLLKKYDICSASGSLGPKRKKGDYQVPEGFYTIDRFNPTSAFHLSLGLNYPNASDKILSDPKDPGGDIFIHGSCVSIGCMAMTHDKIKELYLAAVEAKNHGQAKIPVHIFPFRMSTENMASVASLYQNQAALLNFWENIKIGYDYFEKNKKLSSITVASDGKYKFN